MSTAFKIDKYDFCTPCTTGPQPVPLLLKMVDFIGDNTGGYPVAVFNEAGAFLGNANDADEYVAQRNFDNPPTGEVWQITQDPFTFRVLPALGEQFVSATTRARGLRYWRFEYMGNGVRVFAANQARIVTGGVVYTGFVGATNLGTTMPMSNTNWKTYVSNASQIRRNLPNRPLNAWQEVLVCWNESDESAGISCFNTSNARNNGGLLPANNLKYLRLDVETMLARNIKVTNWTNWYQATATLQYLEVFQFGTSFDRQVLPQFTHMQQLVAARLERYYESADYVNISAIPTLTGYVTARVPIATYTPFISLSTLPSLEQGYGSSHELLTSAQKDAMFIAIASALLGVTPVQYPGYGAPTIQVSKSAAPNANPTAASAAARAQLQSQGYIVISTP